MADTNNKAQSEINAEKIAEQLRQVDDETLKKAIFQAAQALGFNDKKAEKLASEPKLKNRLAHMSENDVSKLMNTISPEKASEIINILNKNK